MWETSRMLHSSVDNNTNNNHSSHNNILCFFTEVSFIVGDKLSLINKNDTHIENNNNNNSTHTNHIHNHWMRTAEIENGMRGATVNTRHFIKVFGFCFCKNRWINRNTKHKGLHTNTQRTKWKSNINF